MYFQYDYTSLIVMGTIFQVKATPKINDWNNLSAKINNSFDMGR